MYSSKEKEYNWKDKESRADLAKKHDALMEVIYPNEINESVRNAKVFTANSDLVSDRANANTEISVVPIDSVTAIFKYVGKDKTCVLNFSDYSRPGGRFLDGSNAQEENLCHESTLYNVLKRCKAFYALNKSLGSNNCLYRNSALYTPDIVFFRKTEIVTCDVLSCAAPNFTAARKYRGVGIVENSRYIRNRIKFVLDVAECNSVDTLILGAYGCGVFGQNPNEVANNFREYLLMCKHGFKHVIFAIPDSSTNSNYVTFKRVFWR